MARCTARALRAMAVPKRVCKTLEHRMRSSRRMGDFTLPSVPSSSLDQPLTRHREALAGSERSKQPSHHDFHMLIPNLPSYIASIE